MWATKFLLNFKIKARVADNSDLDVKTVYYAIFTIQEGSTSSE